MAAQGDVLGPLPRFGLINPEWPLSGHAPRIGRGRRVEASATLGETHAPVNELITKPPAEHYGNLPSVY